MVLRSPAVPLRDEGAAAAWLEGLINLERCRDPARLCLGLERIHALLERLGRPERGLRAVHIAGSKGKGSTALLVEAILRAGGLRVGTFTSPHLVRWTERFRIDGREVPGEALARAVETLRPHVEALRAAGGAVPTFFDATTAAAFVLFREAGIERVVLEVGLGGRLDSTNVVDPAVACVTGIELEHTDRLGSDLPTIAREKAGILKPGRPAVMGRLAPEAAAVVEARAAELGAPLARLGRDFDVKECHAGASGLALRLRDGEVEVAARVPVLGEHQAANAALALACARRLGDLDDGALTEAAGKGLASAALPGRVEVLGRRPWRVVDAAHTPASARALARALEALPRRSTRFLLSVSAGKDLPALLSALLPLAGDVFATRAEPVRSLPAEELAAAVRAAAPGLPVRAVPDPRAAAREALAGLSPEDLLCATGSVYLAGAARSALTDPAPPGAAALDWFGRPRDAGAGGASADLLSPGTAGSRREP